MAYRSPSPRLPQTLEYSEEDEAFLQGLLPWTKDHWSGSFGTSDQNRIRNEIKGRIKSSLEIIQDNYCAFCGLDLRLAHEVHREHIAPQYKQPQYIFEPENLVLACNFCNMHKMKRLTVTSNTGIYGTEIFNILHPHRDDFNQFLSCNFHRNELVFTIVNPENGDLRPQQTIKCVGLAEPHLMSQRGAIILKAAMPPNPILDWFVRAVTAFNRRASR